MNPHVDRCYGYMAMALGLDYWLVPSISANYHMKYHINEHNLKSLMLLVHHVLRKSGPSKHFESIAINVPKMEFRTMHSVSEHDFFIHQKNLYFILLIRQMLRSLILK